MNKKKSSLNTQFCVLRLLQLCESLIIGVESLRFSLICSLLNGTLSLLIAFICDTKDGAVAGIVVDCCGYVKLPKSFLFATSFIELRVLLSQGGQLFFADVNSISVFLKRWTRS